VWKFVEWKRTASASFSPVSAAEYASVFASEASALREFAML
jgi:hypothetical protein